MNAQSVILASTSAYRRELLSRLRIPFEITAPEVDERPLANETAKETSWRLSREKARAASLLHPDALIIGSDQIALLGTQQIGKPITHENAFKQLQLMRGQTITFYTALTLLNARTNEYQTEVAINKVHYRDFTDAQIESYLNKEQPYNCAGSLKSEGLGIALVKGIEGDDPNALIGLPLILLVKMLLNQGVSIL